MKNKLILLGVFPVLLVVLLVFSISTGSVHIPIADTLHALLGQEVKESWYTIIWFFRMPKAITAVIVGGGLAVCGLQMQTLFRNPLAGPFVLGITSGASLGVALLVLSGSIIGGMVYQWITGGWTVVIAASLGAYSVLVIVVFASLRVKDSMSLLILGLMFGSASGALVSILQYFSSAEEIQLFMIWTFGSLGGLNWDELLILFSVVFVGLILNLFLIKPLNALLLGEKYAYSLGINLKKSRLIIILSTSLLAGTITAFCGPIAFVGLAVPHMCRMMLKTSDHKILLPAVALLGGIVLLLCDLVAQLPGFANTLPINAVTSMLGAPFVIWLVFRNKNISKSF